MVPERKFAEKRPQSPQPEQGLSARRNAGDTQADQLNRKIDVRAFTTSQEVFSREREHNPYSMDGQELIIHELAHIVQQRQSKFSRSSERRMTANTPGEAHEQEAD